MARYLKASDALLDYVLRVGVREHPVLERCRTETHANERAAGMQIAPEQGAFMAMLTRLTGARRALEVGVFTGYSSLCVALALPRDGQLIACDVSKEWTDKAKTYWQAAGVADKITLHLRPAVETLDALLAKGEAGKFDFSFIDADKTSYDAYYERVLKLLRPGGLLLIDNVLWSGAVIDPADQKEDTKALRAINQKIHDDSRVEIVLVPFSDGVFMVRKNAREET